MLPSSPLNLFFISCLRSSILDSQQGPPQKGQIKRQGLNLSASQQQRLLYRVQYPVSTKSSVWYLSTSVLLLTSRQWKLTSTFTSQPNTQIRSQVDRSQLYSCVSKHTRSTHSVFSSMDSDLEAFSHYPADGSFAPLAFQPGANTNYLNEGFLSY